MKAKIFCLSLALETCPRPVYESFFWAANQVYETSDNFCAPVWSFQVLQRRALATRRYAATLNARCRRHSTSWHQRTNISSCTRDASIRIRIIIIIIVVTCTVVTYDW